LTGFWTSQKAVACVRLGIERIIAPKFGLSSGRLSLVTSGIVKITRDVFAGQSSVGIPVLDLNKVKSPIDRPNTVDARYPERVMPRFPRRVKKKASYRVMLVNRDFAIVTAIRPVDLAQERDGIDYVYTQTNSKFVAVCMYSVLPVNRRLFRKQFVAATEYSGAEAAKAGSASREDGGEPARPRPGSSDGTGGLQ
jgi:hypothetical protein